MDDAIIEQKLKDLRAALVQQQANLYATQGAIQVLEALLKPQTEPPTP